MTQEIRLSDCDRSSIILVSRGQVSAWLAADGADGWLVTSSGDNASSQAPGHREGRELP